MQGQHGNQFATIDVQMGSNRTRLGRAAHSYQDSDRELKMLENRVLVLREKQARVAEQNRKFSEKAKQAQLFKEQHQQIVQLKDRDDREDREYVQLQRERNRQADSRHRQQLRDIKMALQLVKLSEAKDIKTMSIVHQQKLKAIRQNQMDSNKSRVSSIADEKKQARAHIRSVRHNKMMQIQDHKSQLISNYSALQEQHKLEIQRLQEQERKVLDSLRNSQARNQHLRNSYITIIKSTKEVVRRGEISLGERSLVASRELSGPSRYEINGLDERAKPPKYRVPVVYVNQDKFKHALSLVRAKKKSPQTKPAQNQQRT